MSGVEDMIAQAEKSLGLGENPDNTNYITHWYGLNGQPWCDQAITYWAFHSNNQTAVTYGGKFAYTVAHAQAFKNHGQWHADIAGIRRGDIVFFDWAGSNSIGAIDHIGICTGTSGSSVLTIEGNAANMCGRHVRGANVIAGYGRPSYIGAPTPVKPKPGPSFEPYPGAGVLESGHADKRIARMHDRLVAVGCNAYTSSTEKDMWGTGDRDSYKLWQRKCGWSGVDADGAPGQLSWDKLRVPRA